MKYLVICLLVLSIMGQVIDTYVPCPEISGNVAVRIFYPMPGEERFSTGAPVVIAVQGGWTAGIFQEPNPMYRGYGGIWVTFLHPGATRDSMSTPGPYDTRGEGCIHSLMRVIRFAAGRDSDASGNLITDLLPVSIDTTNIGLFGGSNGGNLVVTTLSIDGALTAGLVDYFISYESPTSSQTSMTDFGIPHDPFPMIDGDGNGVGDDDYTNPYFVAYGDTNCLVDMENIAWDSTFVSIGRTDTLYGAVFIDGNGNGTYDEIMIDGISTPDLDRDQVLERGEDYLMQAISHLGKVYYSTPVTVALFRELGMEDWPSSLALPAQADSFWQIRSAVWHYDNLPEYHPDLAYLVIFNLSDHGQSPPEKHHIHQAFNGFNRNGLFARLNPDREYVSVFGDVTEGFPDNHIGREPEDWADVGDWAIQPGGDRAAAELAAIYEMADRTHYHVLRDPDLTGLIEMRHPTAPPIYVNLVSHSEEPPGTPAYFSDEDLFRFNRLQLKNFCDMLYAEGVTLNWQIEWNFALGITTFDTTEMTGDMNIAEYIVDSLGFPCDPHAHESHFNYADVAHYIMATGVTPSRVAGGFLAMPEEECVLDHLQDVIEADSFPGYTWTPEILWGGATRYHVDDDTLQISGIWCPAGCDDYFGHDPMMPPHVGGYTSDAFGVRQLLAFTELEYLDPEKMYTAAIFFGQDALDPLEIMRAQLTIRDLEEYRNTDRIRFVTIQEAVDIWRDVYDSTPNQLLHLPEAIDENVSIPKDRGLRVFPNPFNSSLEIFTDSVADIEITDMLGRPLFSRKGVTNSFVWNPADLPSGIYLVNAMTERGTETARAILIK